MGGRSKLIVVAAAADEDLTPRGARARALVPELERTWDVEVVPGPWDGRAPGGPAARAAQRLNRRLARHLALDAYEPLSTRTFWRWRPRAELALLMGWPLSWVAAAARALRGAGVPYVVDAGDPWVLTAREPEGSRLVLRRQAEAERRIWSGARGAILTTPRQEAALIELFPRLPTLVRPNGYRPVRAAGEARTWAPGQALELAHFGVLYGHRIEYLPALARLASRGPWEQVVLHQFGAAEQPARSLPSGVSIRRHSPVPWEEVVDLVPSFHALLVVGNEDPALLPSKTIDYGALPAPRIALVGDPADDAIADHVAGRPAWLVIGAQEEAAAPRVEAHVSREWSAAELEPVEEDSWAVGAPAVRSFLESLS